MTTKLEDFATRMKLLKKEMREEGKAALLDAAKELFDKYPVVDAIRWQQYTPYFNDGDTCTFSVNEPEIRLVGVESEDEDEGDFVGDWDIQYYTQRCAPEDRREFPEGAGDAVKAVVDAFDNVPNDLMLYAFGDHVEVTLTRDGIEVTEYEHD